MTFDRVVELHGQTQLRAQLVSQLRGARLIRLGPSAQNERPSLKRKALDHMIAGYMGDVGYGYSLTVFREESGVSDGPVRTRGQPHGLRRRPHGRSRLGAMSQLQRSSVVARQRISLRPLVISPPCSR